MRGRVEPAVPLDIASRRSTVHKVVDRHNAELILMNCPQILTSNLHEMRASIAVAILETINCSQCILLVVVLTNTTIIPVLTGNTCQ